MKILNNLIVIIIKIYKIFVSPLFVNSCKFEPTCSSYAIECFERYNLFKAIFKTSIRIIKCNPWFNTGGFDSPIEKKVK